MGGGVGHGAGESVVHTTCLLHVSRKDKDPSSSCVVPVSKDGIKIHDDGVRLQSHIVGR